MRVVVVGGCGYIGSALCPVLRNHGHDVHVVDLGLRGMPEMAGSSVTIEDYVTAPVKSFDSFDAIVLLAGHSSVGIAADDPVGALLNNIVGLQRMLDIADGRALIYASSGSVYDGLGSHPGSEDSLLAQPRNIYDLTKRVGDELASMNGTNWSALRFGTVNGPSANLRLDLMINRMTADAIKKGQVTVANPHAHRAILSIDDLTGLVAEMLTNSWKSCGVLNVSSFNASIGEIATQVGEIMAVPVVEAASSSTYDFTMSVAKAHLLYGFEPHDDLGVLIDKLAAFYTGSGRHFLD
jgi:nucleoside-diphosphate-sugar epimerase